MIYGLIGFGIILFLEMRNNMIVFTKKVKDGMLYKTTKLGRLMAIIKSII